MAKKRRTRKTRVDPVQQVFNEFFGEAKQHFANSLREMLMPKTPMFQPINEIIEDNSALPLKGFPDRKDIPDGTIIIKDAEVISVRKG